MANNHEAVLRLRMVSDIAKGTMKDNKAIQQLTKSVKELQKYSGRGGVFGNFKAGTINALIHKIRVFGGSIFSLQTVIEALEQEQLLRGLRVQFGLSALQEKELSGQINSQSLEYGFKRSDVTAFYLQLANQTDDYEFTKETSATALKYATTVQLNPMMIGQIVAKLFNVGIKDPKAIDKILTKKLNISKTDLISNSKNLKSKTVDSFGDDKELNNIFEILDQLEKASESFKTEKLKNLGFSNVSAKGLKSLVNLETDKDVIDKDVIDEDVASQLGTKNKRGVLTTASGWVQEVFSLRHEGSNLQHQQSRENFNKIHGAGAYAQVARQAAEENNTYVPENKSEITILLKADKGTTGKVQGAFLGENIKLNVGEFGANHQ